jgi:two-component system NarL family response regulator
MYARLPSGASTPHLEDVRIGKAASGCDKGISGWLPPTSHRKGNPVKRVMIVDDHDFCREGLVEVLAEESDLQVVAECPDGADAVRLVDEVCPDVIVMDLQMPGMNGADATREVLRRRPAARVIIVTGTTGSRLAEQAIAAGACACLPKAGDCGPLLAAIRA